MLKHIKTNSLSNVLNRKSQGVKIRVKIRDLRIAKNFMKQNFCKKLVGGGEEADKCKNKTSSDAKDLYEKHNRA